MDKVSGVSFNLPANVGLANNYRPSAETQPVFDEAQSTPVWDRGVSGHHSSVGKAIEAHRLRVEERNSRTLNRGDVPRLAPQQSAFEEAPVSGISTIAVEPQFQNYDSSGLTQLDSFEPQVIEPPRSLAKTAVVDSFTSVDIDQPNLNEPIPRGSYLDVEA